MNQTHYTEAAIGGALAPPMCLMPATQDVKRRAVSRFWLFLTMLITISTLWKCFASKEFVVNRDGARNPPQRQSDHEPCELSVCTDDLDLHYLEASGFSRSPHFRILRISINGTEKCMVAAAEAMHCSHSTLAPWVHASFEATEGNGKCFELLHCSKNTVEGVYIPQLGNAGLDSWCLLESFSLDVSRGTDAPIDDSTVLISRSIPIRTNIQKTTAAQSFYMTCKCQAIILPAQTKSSSPVFSRPYRAARRHACHEESTTGVRTPSNS